MKIAISATQGSLDAQVDPRFGRCPWLLIVETGDLSCEAVENPNTSLGGGAGIQSALLVVQRGVRCVLTGNCGPNAYQTLSAAGVNVVADCSGTVRQAIARFTAGESQPVTEATVPSHQGIRDFPPDATSGVGSSAVFAMGPGGGRGMGGGGGMGRGGGMGGGRGRGMRGGAGQGRGAGRGMGGGGMGRATGAGGFCSPQAASNALPTDEKESAELHRQAKALNQHLQHIRERIGAANKVREAIAKVDAGLCSGCEACVDACPRGAIQVVDGIARVKEDDCNGCGTCAAECPLNAIQIA